MRKTGLNRVDNPQYPYTNRQYTPCKGKPFQEYLLILYHGAESYQSEDKSKEYHGKDSPGSESRNINHGSHHRRQSEGGQKRKQVAETCKAMNDTDEKSCKSIAADHSRMFVFMVFGKTAMRTVV